MPVRQAKTSPQISAHAVQIMLGCRAANSNLCLHSMLQAELSVSLGLLCCQQVLRHHIQLLSQGVVVLLQAVSSG